MAKYNQFKPKGKSFLAYGMEKDGPYYTYGRQHRNLTAKDSIGSRGAEVSLKYRGKSRSPELRINLSRMRPSFKSKPRKKRRKKK
ncbi:MAG: hypothetical protein ACXADS_15510 [Candidatus Thorarchaeota archaeon]|jgi:hypothetical protein